MAHVHVFANTLTLTSPDFNNGEKLPIAYGCKKLPGGKSQFPRLQWSGIPQETKSLVLIAIDPDAPHGYKQSNKQNKVWTHVIVYNINPKTTSLMQKNDITHALYGKNSSGEHTYSPPCPPEGTHRYFFKLYAIDTMLNTIDANATYKEIENLIDSHIIDKAELYGTYTYTKF
jgi:Raf kinase inhibitor-like YbhB/YbcL family protein